MPVRYYRNDHNLGANANILRVANELARGEFCWILGDDDLARENAVSTVVKALERHPDLDYVFVNHSYEFTSEGQKRPALATGADYPVLRNLQCSEENDHLVDCWEDIISFSSVPGLFTSIITHVFRRSKWLEVAPTIDTDAARPFATLQDTFPHACIIAHTMIGRPALYLGFPHVILFGGTQEWFGLWPMMQVVRLLELSDLFEKLGARREMVDRYRDVVFRTSSYYFWRLLTNPSQSGREYFSFSSLVARYWRYPGFWRMVGRVPRARYGGAVRRLSRRLPRLLQRGVSTKERS
jgi:hypothetical protein